MNNKYEIKTYTNGIQSEISDIEIDKKKLESNKNTNSKTDTEQKNFLKTTFQPKCIFTKQNNNISFYQSNAKNSYRTSKHYKNLSPFTSNKDSTQNNTAIVSNQSLGEEKFSCNFMALRKPNNKNINIEENQNTQRVNINELNAKYKKPKRTIKSYKKQFNVEKSDNFNMLSYRPMEYDSDNNYIKKKYKINQLFKKQGVDEIFYPSKKTHTPHPQNGEIKERYQTHTLKYQSFFGSFNGIKNTRVAKSTSKIKINQLNDFNIEKLIEIGDKYANLRKPVLPLGKIMNNNIMYYNSRIKNAKKKNSC